MRSKTLPLSLVKFEVDCFSIVHPKTGKSSGRLKFFHLFSENEGARFIDPGYLIAYGATAGTLAEEWVKNNVNQKNTNTKNNIN